ncbi:hypothetical protein [Hoeflea sp. TYP-13]|uniref:hypothetical protein n=1 Tax=Hoeflea sp. TYP-13 TaxID=3230023 RepID=UPI0034C652B2
MRDRKDWFWYFLGVAVLMVIALLIVFRPTQVKAQDAKRACPAPISIATELGRMGYTSTWVVQQDDGTITGYRFINLKTGDRLRLTCVGPCPDFLP